MEPHGSNCSFQTPISCRNSSFSLAPNLQLVLFNYVLTLTKARTGSDWVPNHIQEQKSNRRAKYNLISSATTTMHNPLDIFHSRVLVKGEGREVSWGEGCPSRSQLKL